MGAEPVALRWVGAKPSTGLPAAARRARHALIAEAARSRGVRAVLFAHTADDAAEGEWMRARGAPLGRLREWAPSPVWPEGRGVFLLRPLLPVTRAALREHLDRHGLTWLEDPANTDLRFARARARAALEQPAEASPAPQTATAPAFSADDHGVVRGPRSQAIARKQLASALVCAAGGEDSPRGPRLDALLGRLDQADAVSATLGGARVVADGTRIIVARELGRAGGQELELGVMREAVWDRRFLVSTSERGVRVRPLAGLAARLSPIARRALTSVPAVARPALPAFVTADGTVACPLLEPSPHRAVSLVGDRLRAASGQIVRESDVTARPPLLAR